MDATDHNAMSMLMHLFLGLMYEMNYDKAEKKNPRNLFQQLFYIYWLHCRSKTWFICELIHTI